MLRIKNLKKDNSIISFNYFCEDNEKEKGHVVYDLDKETVISYQFAPIEEEVGYEMYQKAAIGFARKMIKDNKEEDIFIWY